MPKISIIIPVYNGESYLHQCIDSILSQTFTDFEVLLVDDGSTDNSGEICDEYSQKDNRIIVFHKRNEGQASARNYAIEYSRAEWICFIDSDDVIHPRMIEYLFAAVSNDKTDIAICDCYYAQQIPADFLRFTPYSSSIIFPNEKYLTTIYLDKDRFEYWVVWAKLVKKDIVVNNLFESGRVFEDNAIVFKWLSSANAISLVNQKLYFYRSNSTGTTSTRTIAKEFDYLWAMEEQLSYYLDKTYFDLLNHIANEYFYWVSYLYKRLSDNQYNCHYIHKANKKAKRTIRKKSWKIYNKYKEHLVKRQSYHIELLSLFYPNAMSVLVKLKTYKIDTLV